MVKFYSLDIENFTTPIWKRNIAFFFSYVIPCEKNLKLKRTTASAFYLIDQNMLLKQEKKGTTDIQGSFISPQFKAKCCGVFWSVLSLNTAVASEITNKNLVCRSPSGPRIWLEFDKFFGYGSGLTVDGKFLLFKYRKFYKPNVEKLILISVTLI